MGETLSVGSGSWEQQFPFIGSVVFLIRDPHWGSRGVVQGMVHDDDPLFNEDVIFYTVRLDSGVVVACNRRDMKPAIQQEYV